MNEKVTEAIKLLKDNIFNGYDTVVTFSGGKNSLVALHLTLQVKEDVKVVFNNTTNDFPENLKYVRKIAKEWNLNFYELKPRLTWVQCMEKFGFPHISREKYGEPPCCNILKTEPMYHWLLKQWKTRNIITGISAYENRARWKLFLHLGKVYETFEIGRGAGKKLLLPYKVKKIHPVMDWKEKEIWDYIEKNDLPVNPIYEKYNIKRFGCMLCTGHLAWKEQLEKVNPKALRWILRKLEKQYNLDYNYIEKNEV